MKQHLLALFMCLALPATAQDSLLSSGGQPVAINADSLEWRQNDQAYVARGNAQVTQDGTTLTAQTLTARYAEKLEGGGNRIKLIEAEGGVYIKAENQEIFGRRGVYDMERQVAVLTGDNLKFTMGNDVVTARDALEFWQKDNIAVARGGAKAVRADQIIAADVLKARLARDKNGKSRIEKMSAEGNVIITTAAEIAQGDRGMFDPEKNTGVLEGNVRITRGQNQLNGVRATVDMNTGVSRLVAGPGQQVKALMAPENAPEVAP